VRGEARRCLACRKRLRLVFAARWHSAVLAVTSLCVLWGKCWSDGFLSNGIYVQSFHYSNFLTRTWSGSCLDEYKKPLRAEVAPKNLILEYQVQ